MGLNTKRYYDYNMPQGEFVTESVVWTAGASPSLIITPSVGMALFVTKIKFMIDATFAMTATDTAEITINAYDAIPSQIIGITSTGAIDDDLMALLALCNPDTLSSHTIGGTAVEVGAIEFKPPVYLRSSTTTVESVSIDFTYVGGGITAGSMIVCYEGYRVLEANSGLSS